MIESEAFNFACVFLTLLFCCWTAIMAVRTDLSAIPFGRLGRIILLINSFALGTTCGALLILKIFGVLNAAA